MTFPSREVAQRFAAQRGALSRAQLYAIGVSPAQIRSRLASGEWETAGPGVFRLTATPNGPALDLMALLLSAGDEALASHRSAAWVWRMLGPPDRPEVSVGRSGSRRSHRGIAHHRRQWPLRAVLHDGFFCTDPLRTVVDLAGVLPPEQLEEPIDRALGSRLVTVEALVAELDRCAVPGLAGTRALRQALKWSQVRPGNDASVLERMTLRLLERAGIVPLGTEVTPHSDLGYRVDFMLAPGLAMEVDGYAYHQGAAQMANDARRRNRLKLAGTSVLVYTWRDIAFDGGRVLNEVRMALAHAVAG